MWLLQAGLSLLLASLAGRLSAAATPSALAPELGSSLAPAPGVAVMVAAGAVAVASPEVVVVCGGVGAYPRLYCCRRVRKGRV